MYSLEVQELTQRVGKTTIVNNVSFALQPGELLAILGPPESGKTALLRLISGLEQPNRGRVIINGEDVTGAPANKRRVSMLFQDGYGLLAHMPVFEILTRPLKSTTLSQEKQEQNIALIAQTLEMSHLLERKVGTLTRGERLTVALAHALVKNPALYLFDEIFQPLDTPTRLEARRKLVEIRNMTNISCVYTTSDPSDAFALTDRVAIMYNGEIQQIGTRAELMNTPATLWVARWLGFPTMNTLTGFVQGTYQPEGICYRVWAKGFIPLLPAKWTPLIEALKTRDITFGIRPESIIPEWEFQEKWQPSWSKAKGEIVASEWHQGKTLVQIQLPHADEPLLAVFAIAHDQVKLGQAITITCDPESICLFHPSTQQLLQPSMEPASLNMPQENMKKRPLFNFRR